MTKAKRKKRLDDLTRQIQEGVEEGYKLAREMGESLGEGLNRLLPRRKAVAELTASSATGWVYKHRVAQTA